jgi:hypothetical protein
MIDICLMVIIEFGIEWTFNQSDEFKVINSLRTQNEFKVINSLRTQNPKHRMNNVGMAIIPFNECLWNDTYLPNCRFSTK